MPMNFAFEERPADSPLIETVWQAHDGRLLGNGANTCSKEKLKWRENLL
jgi:hypothetical protein